MITLLMIVLNVGSANAYENGVAPFCTMDNYGNTNCFYYDLQSCRIAASYQPNSACVHR